MKPHHISRPPKWPYLMGALALLTVAVVIGLMEERPFSDTAYVIIFLCAFLSAATMMTPFILDFSAARQNDLLEAREGLESLAQKLSESADFIGTVAGQLHAINEATQKAIHLAEALPYKMQEKVGEVAQLVQQGQDEEKEAMAAELEELRENESRHLETAIDKARASLDAAVKRVEAAEKALAAATVALESRAAAAPAPASTAALAPSPSETHAKESHLPRANPEPPPLTPAPAAAKAATHSSNGGGHETGKHREPVRHPKPEKAAHPHATKSAAKPEKPAAPAAAEEAKSEPAPEAERTAAPAPQPVRRKPAKPAAEHDTLPGRDPVIERDDDAATEDGAAAKTSDGSTRLLVTAYIGIGNKVFVRGDGPGLNPEKGQPMEFVSIGKWLWQTSEATAPVTVQVYKNDEIKALGEEITIDPGHHVEVTPVFREANPF